MGVAPVHEARRACERHAWRRVLRTSVTAWRQLQAQAGWSWSPRSARCPLWSSSACSSRVRTAVPEFVGLPTGPPPPPFQVAAPQALAASLTAAGLQDVTVHQESWKTPIESTDALWDEVTASNPLGAQAVAGLAEWQRIRALAVLDGMPRERFGGRPGGVLRAAVNVARGIV